MTQQTLQNLQHEFDVTIDMYVNQRKALAICVCDEHMVLPNGRVLPYESVEHAWDWCESVSFVAVSETQMDSLVSLLHRLAKRRERADALAAFEQALTESTAHTAAALAFVATVDRASMLDAMCRTLKLDAVTAARSIDPDFGEECARCLCTHIENTLTLREVRAMHARLTRQG